MRTIEVTEVGVCPFSGLQGSCTHDDTKPGYGCTDSLLDPAPPWCPLHEEDVRICIRKNGRSIL